MLHLCLQIGKRFLTMWKELDSSLANLVDLASRTSLVTEKTTEVIASLKAVEDRVIDQEEEIDELNRTLENNKNFRQEISSLKIKAEFLEEQLGFLEATYDPYHIDDFTLKDNHLNIRTTESILDNLMAEYGFLKRHYNGGHAAATPESSQVSVFSDLPSTSSFSSTEEIRLKPLRCRSVTHKKSRFNVNEPKKRLLNIPKTSRIHARRFSMPETPLLEAPTNMNSSLRHFMSFDTGLRGVPIQNKKEQSSKELKKQTMTWLTKFQLEKPAGLVSESPTHMSLALDSDTSPKRILRSVYSSQKKTGVADWMEKWKWKDQKPCKRPPYPRTVETTTVCFDALQDALHDIY